jgi:hypothetical protein
MKFLNDTPWYGYVLVIVAFCAGAVLVASFVRSNERSDKNETALIALCALRVDLDLRIESSQKLLTETPRGPIFGTPRSVIKSSLTSSQRTREALDVLECG